MILQRQGTSYSSVFKVSRGINVTMKTKTKKTTHGIFLGPFQIRLTPTVIAICILIFSQTLDGSYIGHIISIIGDDGFEITKRI